MALAFAHSFLAGGPPLYTASDFRTEYCSVQRIFASNSRDDATADGTTTFSSPDVERTHLTSARFTEAPYGAWVVALLGGRGWCTDARKTRIRTPCAVAIFGVPCGTGGSATAEVSGKASSSSSTSMLHLLYCSVLEQMDPVACVQEAAACIDHVATIADGAAVPSTIYTAYYSAAFRSGSGACVLDAWLGLSASEIEQRMATLLLQKKYKAQVLSVSAPATTDSGPLPQALCEETFVACIEWMHTTRGMFPDVSTQPFMGACGTTGPDNTNGTSSDVGTGNSEKSSTREWSQEQLLKLALDCPLLSSARLLPLPPASTTTTTSTTTGGYRGELVEGGDVPDPTRSRDLVAGAFTVPHNFYESIRSEAAAAVKLPTAPDTAAETATAPPPPPQPFPHVLVLQRPVIISPAAALNNDLTSPGPIQPQPVGVELHLFADAGDACFIARKLQRDLNTELLEDLLHADGEVFVQMGPLEGAAEADATAVLQKAIEQRKAEDNNKGGEEEQTTSSVANKTNAVYNTNHRCVVWDAATSRAPTIAVPRVVHNVPVLGDVSRRTPLEGTRTTIQSTSPTDDMLLAAVCALRYFTVALCCKNKSGPTDSASVTTYAIDWTLMTLLSTTADPQSVPPAAPRSLTEPVVGTPPPCKVPQGPAELKACTFCGRERQRILRCGACRVAQYCSKDHQAKDWKGGHSKDCKLQKQAAEDLETVLRPLLATRLDALETSVMATEDMTALKNSAAWSPQWLATEIGTSNAKTLLAILKQCHFNNFFGHTASTTVGVSSRRTRHHDALVAHVLHVDDPAGFLRGLAAVLEALPTKPAQQLRILLINSKGIKTADQHKVFALYKSGGSGGKKNGSNGGDSGENNGPTFVDAPATGALGDVWHLETAPSQRKSGSGNDEVAVVSGAAAAPQPSEAMCLVRFYANKYHHFGLNSTVATFSHDKADGVGIAPSLTPDLLVSLGRTSYNGLSFFDAITEVAGDYYLGKIPVAVAEPHLVTCHRSAQAFLSRSPMSPINPKPSLDANTAGKVTVNTEGVCPLPLSVADAASTSNDNQSLHILDLFNQARRRLGLSSATSAEVEGVTVPQSVSSSATPLLLLNAYTSVILPQDGVVISSSSSK